jgi:hypothetical protein
LFTLLSNNKPEATVLAKSVFPLLKRNMNSFFTKGMRRTRYLFDNFVSKNEDNPLSLTFNMDPKKRLSTGQFHVYHSSVMFKLGSDEDYTHTFKTNGVEKGKKDIALFARRLPNRQSRHRVLHITSISTSLFEINNLDIHYPLPLSTSTSPGVNSETIGLYLADPEFNRLRNGSIRMHIPVAQKIDRLTPKRLLALL